MTNTIPDLHLPGKVTIPGSTLAGFFWGGVDAGVQWLAGVPTLLELICHKHTISNVQPVPNLRMNLVLFGDSAIHGPVVIKLAPPNWEVTNEITALRIFATTGHYAPLIDADIDQGWSLQSRVAPGEMLQSLTHSGEISDEEATRITAGLMQKVIAPVPSSESHEFVDLRGWLRSLWAYAESGKTTIPAAELELALRHARNLVANPGPPMLLHGDFHHGNILRGASDWVMIDPKGIVAEKGFEVGPFFYNPIGIDQHPNLVDVFDQRLDIFSQELGIDRVRLWQNALVACVLSDCWSLEDGPVDHCHYDTVTAALMQLPERNA